MLRARAPNHELGNSPTDIPVLSKSNPSKRIVRKKNSSRSWVINSVQMPDIASVVTMLSPVKDLAASRVALWTSKSAVTRM